MGIYTIISLAIGFIVILFFGWMMYLLDIFVMKKALLTAILPLSSKTAGIYICLQTSQSTNIRL